MAEARAVKVGTLRDYIKSCQRDGKCLAYVIHFCMDNCGLRKISPRQALTETNDAVDDGPVFVGPWTVDSSAAMQ